jgi:hypothetical protein
VLRGHPHRCVPRDPAAPRSAGTLTPEPDLKPENVLVSIDDVESIISTEIAAGIMSAAPPPTKLVGVPPSKVTWAATFVLVRR